jgi:AAA+ superfamily predicted ATPase
VAFLGSFPPSSRFDKLGRGFGLAQFDLKYERIYAYLQDDVNRRRPSVDLALNLLCVSTAEKLARRAYFAPDGRLLTTWTITRGADYHARAAFPSWPVRLDEQVVRFLLVQPGLGPRLSPFCQVTRPEARVGSAASSLSGRELRWLADAVVRAVKGRRPLRLYFRGSPGAGQAAVAAALAAEAGVPLLSVDLVRWLASARPNADESIRVLLREAVFRRAVLYLEPWDALGDAGAGPQPLRDALPPELAGHGGVVIVTGERPWTPSARGPRGVVSVRFGVPPYAVRRACWQDRAREAQLPMAEAQLDALADLYRLKPEQIGDAVATVAATHPPADRYAVPPPPEAFFEAARAQSGHALARLARRVEPVHGWDDLGLAADVKQQLREVCLQIHYKRLVREEWGFGRKVARSGGTSALFSGPTGTGKTTAASIIARELHLDLYEIDLARVVSKYIGETEQNLRQTFDAAVNSNAILQFNEADALWGKRSEVHDAHDRYANMETAFLLQEMEVFEGVVILTTNLRQNLDEAFIRRLDFIVEFPFPDEAARRRIWEVLLPDEAPREEIDLEVLARVRLSGGHIKNAVYAAAFYAAAEERAITTADLVQAVRREYQKLGRVLNEAELEPFAHGARR